MIVIGDEFGVKVIFFYGCGGIVGCGGGLIYEVIIF